MHDGMPYGRIQGQGQGHSREVDRQSPTGLIFINIWQCIEQHLISASIDSSAFVTKSLHTYLGRHFENICCKVGCADQKMNERVNIPDSLVDIYSSWMTRHLFDFNNIQYVEQPGKATRFEKSW